MDWLCQVTFFCNQSQPYRALNRLGEGVQELPRWLFRARTGQPQLARVHCDGLPARRMASHRPRLRQ